MSTIAIIHFGSQFTQLIAKQVREMCVYCEILSPRNLDDNIISHFNGFIFSGGPQSVHDNYCEISHVVHKIIQLNDITRVPILGICYGHQLLCHYFGSQVKKNFKQEFGKTKIKILRTSEIIHNIWNVGSQAEVLMNHTDSIENLPQDFIVIATSLVKDSMAIVVNEKRKIFCTQFHPEVHATTNGYKLISNFLDISKCQRTWTMNTVITQKISKIQNIVKDQKVIAAVSGGIDSSVAAAITYQAIGKQLNCIFIDTGLLCKNHNISISKDIPIKYINQSSLFLAKLQGVINPEQKRKIIGETFIKVFEKEARKIGNVNFLMQGTIYSDVIESGHCAYNTSIIKSHHNVGGLPSQMNLRLLEPLRDLFKDEVKRLGKELNLSDQIISQHPFPGPGLAVRIISAIDQEKINILQEIDCLYISTLKSYNLYNKIWQAFAVLLPIKAVGIIGDNRAYGYVCALRAVTSTDGMTADVFPFANKQQDALIFWDFLQTVSHKIVNNISGITRVVYDVTSKPPATIEWE
ncbi:glutamine-hydrolyzing GMP synthase [Wolbachia endosymbiont of Howardula sp.]|uniref:glutamine-hydrolyzing GMP synthase n=1 Tax=Wolbachia endosymbiont of Howardula sp. TaxID=2916816 RepID=UPI00217D9086|nr:glutamine-hydrolyzing GMP synthase [Wolbachia endosymbiont of Howardula sp.]UWI83192.1 glutamine-hydrolyzing GMP synthase [Wolbachia endosymbiont of Howardula sp.]